MEFIETFGMFLLKTLTVVVGSLMVVGAVIRGLRRDAGPEEGRLRVSKLNRRYRQLAREVRSRVMPRRAFKRLGRKERRDDRERARRARDGDDRRRVYVLRFDGDIRASAVDGLRREITAVLLAAEDGDEVLVRLDSAGGLVHAYGLAAAQLERIKERGLRLTVAVDRIAASGGYLMAVVADRLVAAPFAVVGSIGVVATVPNLNRLLGHHKVDVEQHTAGDYKRTLSVLGPNTPEGRAKFVEQLEDTHGLFRAFVARYRPGLDVDRVSTGEHWYGTQALELGLVDALGTSDQLLLDSSEEADLIQVRFEQKPTVGRRLSTMVGDAAGQAWAAGWQASQESRFR